MKEEEKQTRLLYYILLVLSLLLVFIAGIYDKIVSGAASAQFAMLLMLVITSVATHIYLSKEEKEEE